MFQRVLNTAVWRFLVSRTNMIKHDFIVTILDDVTIFIMPDYLRNKYLGLITGTLNAYSKNRFNLSLRHSHKFKIFFLKIIQKTHIKICYIQIDLVKINKRKIFLLIIQKLHIKSVTFKLVLVKINKRKNIPFNMLIVVIG